MTAPGSPGTEKIFISSLQQCCAKGTVLPVCRLTAEPGECLLVKPPCFTRQTSPLLASEAAMQLQSGKNGSLLPPSFPFNVPCTFCFSLCFYKDSTQPSCTAFLHKNASLKAAVACQKPSQTPARSAVQPHRCLPAPLHPQCEGQRVCVLCCSPAALGQRLRIPVAGSAPWAIPCAGLECSLLSSGHSKPIYPFSHRVRQPAVCAHCNHHQHRFWETCETVLFPEEFYFTEMTKNSCCIGEILII